MDWSSTIDHGEHGRVYCSTVNTQPDESSPPWCVRLISELNAADERATALAKPLSPEQLNWRPRSAEWSIGQCLEHLCIGNELYCQALANSLVGHPLSVVQEIRPGWFGQWFIRNYIEPSPDTRRVRAPKKVRPGARIEPSIVDRFVMSNDKAREVVNRARNLDVNRVRFTNPFFPLIRFTVGTGLEVVSQHNSRHLLQAERIRSDSEFPVG